MASSSSTPEDKGGMCMHCTRIRFGEEHDQHMAKLSMSKGDRYRFTEETPEGDMTVTAEVRRKVGMDESDSHPAHYMCIIQKIEVDGEDRTEEYLEKAFDGEKQRGIPLEQICGMDIEIL